MRGHYKNANNDHYCEVIIVDEIREEVHETMGFVRAIHEEYTKINNTFEVVKIF